MFDGRVLRFVENDETLVQRSPAHEGKRRNLYDVAIDQLADPVETEHFVQSVVHRAQIGIDFLRQIAWKKTQPFACLDGGPNQHDTPDIFLLKCLDGAGDSQISLAGAGRTYAERQIVTSDAVDIGALMFAPGANQFSPNSDLPRIRVCRFVAGIASDSTISTVESGSWRNENSTP